MLFELKAQEPRWLNPVKLRCQVKRGLLCFYSLVIIHAQSVRPGNDFTNAAETFERVRVSNPQMAQVVQRQSSMSFPVINFWNVEPRVATNFLPLPIEMFFRSRETLVIRGINGWIREKEWIIRNEIYVRRDDLLENLRNLKILLWW